MSLTALLEELSLNACPGTQQLHDDGWVLQVSPGRWRRANSVQMLHPSSRPLDQKIAVCEAFYAARRALFRLFNRLARPHRSTHLQHAHP
jgi:hypothetical protein